MGRKITHIVTNRGKNRKPAPLRAAIMQKTPKNRNDVNAIAAAYGVKPDRVIEIMREIGLPLERKYPAKKTGGAVPAERVAVWAELCTNYLDRVIKSETRKRNLSPVTVEMWRTKAIFYSYDQLQKWDPSKGKSLRSYIVDYWKYALKRTLGKNRSAPAMVNNLSDSDILKGSTAFVRNDLQKWLDAKKNPDFDPVRIHSAIRQLKPAAQQIIRMRFGIYPYDHPLTLSEVGKKLGVTASRVQQRQADALKKLQKWLERPI